MGCQGLKYLGPSLRTRICSIRLIPHRQSIDVASYCLFTSLGIATHSLLLLQQCLHNRWQRCCTFALTAKQEGCPHSDFSMVGWDMCGCGAIALGPMHEHKCRCSCLHNVLALPCVICVYSPFGTSSAPPLRDAMLKLLFFTLLLQVDSHQSEYLCGVATLVWK